MIKKTIYVITFLFVLLAGAAKAQPVEKTLPDSLAVLLKENDQADLNRVQVLSKIATELIHQRKFQESLFYINEIEELSDILNDNYVKVLGKYYKGTYFTNMGCYEEAFTCLLEAEYGFQQLRKDDKTLLLGASIYNSLGGLYCSRKMFPEFYQSIQKGFEINKALKDERVQKVLEINYANMLCATDQYAEAIVAYQGLLAQPNYLDVYERCLIMGNMAQCYRQLSQIDSCLFYLEAAKSMQALSTEDAAVLLNAEAIAFQMDGNDREAIRFAQQSLDTLLYADNRESASKSYSILASSYNRLSENNTAAYYVDLAIETAQDYALLWNEVEAMQIKCKVLYDKGQYREAFEFLQLANALNDSLSMIERQNQLEQIQFQNQLKEIEATLKHDKEMDELMHNKQLLKLYMVILLLIAIVLLVVLLLNRKNNLLNNKRVKETALTNELEEKKRELVQRLLSQMRVNESLNDLIKTIEKDKDNKTKQAMAFEITRKIRLVIKDNSKTDFDYYFIQVHPGFFDRLRADFPNLTASELRLCAFIKLNLNNKEIALLNNISVNSVKMARYRIKRKLKGHLSNDNLEEMIARY